MEEKKPILPPIIYRRLEGCYPPFREQVIKFLLAAHMKGLYVYVVQGYRSFKRQDQYYAKGRRGISGEKIVTKAKGGQSYHNYGVAIDLAFDEDLIKEGVQWSWDKNLPWDSLGALGEAFGLGWGGNWPGFKGDLGHFHRTYGFTVKQLKEFYDAGGLKNVWKELDKAREE